MQIIRTVKTAIRAYVDDKGRVVVIFNEALKRDKKTNETYALKYSATELWELKMSQLKQAMSVF